MDNYLKILYKTYFEAISYEKELMSKHPEAKIETIRNDQAITEARKNNDVIKSLLIQYIEYNYDKKVPNLAY